MSENTATQTPGRWAWGIGEASRPLSDGGYYLHNAYRRTFKNQYVERYLEMRVDTVGVTPRSHVLLLQECTNDGSEVLVGDRLATHEVDVIDPDREASQRWAEKQIHDKAIELMEQHP